MRILLVVVAIVLTIGGVSLAVYYQQNSNKSQSELDSERLLRFNAEETLEKANAKVASLESELDRLKKKNKSIETKVDQVSSINSELKQQLDQISKIKNDLESKIEQLQEITAEQQRVATPVVDIPTETISQTGG